MTKKMPPYLDKIYPLQTSVHETKNSALEVQKRCDARCQNETEEKSHNWYIDIKKYETVERSKCVAPFVGKVFNGEGSIHNRYCPRRLFG